MRSDKERSNSGAAVMPLAALREDGDSRENSRHRRRHVNSLVKSAYLWLYVHGRPADALFISRPHYHNMADVKRDAFAQRNTDLSGDEGPLPKKQIRC